MSRRLQQTRCVRPQLKSGENRTHMQMCGVFEGPDVASHLQSFSIFCQVLFLPLGPEDTYLAGTYLP